MSNTLHPDPHFKGSDLQSSRLSDPDMKFSVWSDLDLQIFYGRLRTRSFKSFGSLSLVISFLSDPDPQFSEGLDPDLYNTGSVADLVDVASTVLLQIPHKLREVRHLLRFLFFFFIVKAQSYVSGFNVGLNPELN